MDEKRNEWYQKLSAGMRQKVYLALPFIIQPEVLILDEPTVHLDIFTRREVWNAILKLSGEMGTTVLLTTHNLNEAERLCDRILFFNKRKIAEGKPRELVEKVQALKEERKLIAKIKGKVNAGEFKSVIQKIEVQSDGRFTYLQLYFRSDELGEVLSLLSRYDVVDLQSAPVTLEEVFLQLCKE
ncbi:ATP-binding cassette domain-containing protein [Thermococcus sp.]